jgi:two-component system, OmpR family, sensor histidine kinase ChvG
MKQKKSASILKKFLLFNFLVFLIIGLYTVLYIKAVQPNLVKKRSSDHIIIINNTSDHIKRLNIEFNEESIKKFLLSTRFLFQSLDRVQFYDTNGKIVGDTNILDLDQNVFSKSDIVIQENLDGSSKKNNIKSNITSQAPDLKNKIEINNIILNQYKNKPLILEKVINNNFFVSTLDKVKINEEDLGFIIVTEEANDIVFAVEERKNFVIRTVIAVTLVILIFSLFLNKYILKPIKFLVMYVEAIKLKSEKPFNTIKFIIREDEIGKLTNSINEMTLELQKRTNRAETFSTDLAHEIRNPLASLKGASELIDKTQNKVERNKLLKIINHDVERIERLITDYSQMLKDEASLSREKMKKINLNSIVKNVVDDFRQNMFNQNKKININIIRKNIIKNEFFILGIENRIEQVIANLLDNSISFSKDNSEIDIEINEVKNNFILSVKDEGPGFNESSTNKIFKRFYSNRPSKFGEHSGLGLNIVKNIIELHKGQVLASNRTDTTGAKIEVILPKSG